jgi:hypothetical protein
MAGAVQCEQRYRRFGALGNPTALRINLVVVAKVTRNHNRAYVDGLHNSRELVRHSHFAEQTVVPREPLWLKRSQSPSRT